MAQSQYFDFESDWNGEKHAEKQQCKLENHECNLVIEMDGWVDLDVDYELSLSRSRKCGPTSAEP